ncbi:MAG: exodeoxyribonuclease VII large subunit [Paracoccaceae bacterium]
MSDMFEDDAPAGGNSGDNSPEFTVSEISGAVKRTIEGEFGHVRVRGEVGRVSRPGSGHIYFDLKDDRAVIAAVSWKGQAAKLAHRPEEGMEVIATGRMTTFPGQSRYQLIVEDIQPAGAGALMAMLEARKKALAAEGLFAAELKKPLPYLPEVIGVITSPTGAVIRDILHRLRDRFPRKVLIWPVAVQGQACASEVARAIAGFNAMSAGGALPRPDLLIVARGGGSVEDLWGFNEEIVARAAAASDIPLISAVGHETDTTLIDYVSDRRAPTPTAAAELAVPVRLELLAWTGEQGGRLSRALSGGIGQRRQRLRDLGRALPRADTLLDGPRQRLDRAGERLPGALLASTQARRVRLSEAASGLRPGAMRARLVAHGDRAGALGGRLAPALSRGVAVHRRDLGRGAARLDPARVSASVLAKRESFESLAARLSSVALGQVAAWQAKSEALERMRQTLGYRATLQRGYAVVRADGAVATSVAAAQGARALEIEFGDGRFAVGSGSSAAPIAPPEPAKKPAPKKPTAKKSDPPEGQGSLF